jgi:hypothetical protein
MGDNQPRRPKPGSDRNSLASDSAEAGNGGPPPPTSTTTTTAATPTTAASTTPTTGTTTTSSTVTPPTVASASGASAPQGHGTGQQAMETDDVERPKNPSTWAEEVMDADLDNADVVIEQISGGDENVAKIPMPPTDRQDDNEHLNAAAGASGQASAEEAIRIKVGKDPSSVSNKGRNLVDKDSKVSDNVGSGDQIFSGPGNNVRDRQDEEERGEKRKEVPDQTGAKGSDKPVRYFSNERQVQQVHEDFQQFLVNRVDLRNTKLREQTQMFLKDLKRQMFTRQTKSSAAAVKAELQEMFAVLHYHVKGLYYWVKRVDAQHFPVEQELIHFAENRANISLESLAILFEDCMAYLEVNMPEYYGHCFDLFVGMKDKTKRVLRRIQQWDERIEQRSEVSSFGIQDEFLTQPHTKGRYEEDMRLKQDQYLEQADDFRNYKPGLMEPDQGGATRRGSARGARRGAARGSTRGRARGAKAVPRPQGQTQTAPDQNPGVRFSTPEQDRVTPDGATGTKPKERPTMSTRVKNPTQEKVRKWVGNQDARLIVDDDFYQNNSSQSSDQEFHTPRAEFEHRRNVQDNEPVTPQPMGGPPPQQWEERPENNLADLPPLQRRQEPPEDRIELADVEFHAADDEEFVRDENDYPEDDFVDDGFDDQANLNEGFEDDYEEDENFVPEDPYINSIHRTPLQPPNLLTRQQQAQEILSPWTRPRRQGPATTRPAAATPRVTTPVTNPFTAPPTNIRQTRPNNGGNRGANQRGRGYQGRGRAMPQRNQYQRRYQPERQYEDDIEEVQEPRGQVQAREPEDPAVYPPDDWFLDLPMPWNVAPREPEKKISDYLKSSPFLKNKFSGEEDDYFEWRSEFITSVHLVKTSIQTKIKYMRSTLCNKSVQTSHLVSAMRSSTSRLTYRTVILSLEEKFGGPDRLLQMRTIALDEYPKIKEGDVVTLAGYLDMCHVLADELTAQGLAQELGTRSWFYKVSSHFPESFIEKYNDYCFLANQERKDTNNLIRWATHKLKNMLDAKLSAEPKKKSVKKQESSDTKKTTSKLSSTAETSKPFKSSVFTGLETSDSDEEIEDLDEASDWDSFDEAVMLENLHFSAASTTKEKFDPMCPICKVKHLLVSCETFKEKMNAQQRKEIILKNKLCIICFKPHFIKDCKSKLRCGFCKGKHHRLLHPDKGVSSKSNVQTGAEDSASFSTQ